MVKQYKVDAVKELVEKLSQKHNFILTNYSGIKDSEIRRLRIELRKKGATYSVVRNNLFRRALKDSGVENDFSSYLKGPIAVAFMNDEFGEIAKVFKTFKTEQDKFSFFLAYVDGTLYDEKSVKVLADLPSKEVLLSQTMSLINGPATKVAIGINQIMASLARGINAVAEKNGNAA